MAVDNVAWMIGGPDNDTPGPKHSAEIVRQAHHDATGGAEGISSVAALRVVALAVPGAAVRVLPGGATLLNRYQGGDGQSYSVRNATQTEVPITATGSGGGRTDLIVIRVLDPQYDGQYPLAPDDFQYTRLTVIEGVPAGTKTFRELNLNYPAIELAKVTLPKNTGTITAGMVTDLRSLSQPKALRRVYPVRINVAGVEELSGTAGEYWPNAGGVQSIFVPDWATHMNVYCTWAQVFIPANANPFGTLTLRFGPWDGAKNKYETQYVSFDALAGTNNQRTNFILPVNRSVPADIRGTTQPFVLFGVNSSASTAGKRAKLDTGSAVSMDIEFLQVAE